MENKKGFFILTASLVCISAVSFVVAYSLYGHRLYQEKPITETPAQETDGETATETSSPTPRQEDANVMVSTFGDKITPETKIIYQYYDKEKDEIIRHENEPLYFMVDLTRDMLATLYNDWQILSFSTQEVVLQKKATETTQEVYIIGEYDGYVTIFYQNHTGGSDIKEVTNTPVSSLSPNEQNRLKQGFVIEGDDELIKILEDYGS